jgi:hypothetical protein
MSRTSPAAHGRFGLRHLSDVVASPMRVSAGAVLMLANSAIFASIGVLVFPLLRPYHQISACAYLIARPIEGVMLAVGVRFLLLLVPLGDEHAAGVADVSVLPSLALVAEDANLYAYQFGMISLGLGSLLFCRVLLRARLVPRFMAVWGWPGTPSSWPGRCLSSSGTASAWRCQSQAASSRSPWPCCSSRGAFPRDRPAARTARPPRARRRRRLPPAELRFCR